MGDDEFSPSALEVDYDRNITELYQAITDQDWEKAITVCKFDPEQAATWVVRHYQDDDNDDVDEDQEPEVMWRFLPLHSACARQPPATVISALLRAYPDGARCQDDQGMFALHYACGNQASRDAIRLLLVANPEAAKRPDPRGMLPIHYLACWGPSSVAVVDMLLVANRDVAEARDTDGNTPADLARDGDYPEKQAVLSALQKWIMVSNVDGGSTTGSVSGGASAASASASASAAPSPHHSINHQYHRRNHQQNPISSSNQSHMSRRSTLSDNVIPPVSASTAGSRSSSRQKATTRGSGTTRATTDNRSFRTDTTATNTTANSNDNNTNKSGGRSYHSNNSNHNRKSFNNLVSPRNSNTKDYQNDNMYKSAHNSKHYNVIHTDDLMHAEEKKDDDSHNNRPVVMAVRADISSPTAHHYNRYGTPSKMTTTPSSYSQQHHSSIVSSDEVRRMAEEIRALKDERGSWDKKLMDAQRKYEKQAVEILDLREELDELRQNSNDPRVVEGSISRGQQNKELRQTKQQLRECKDELKGLRVTLGDMMEEHESFKKRSGNMNDRLGSLSLSLESLMDQQDNLVRSLHKRDENRKQAIKYRQEKLKQLCELEDLCDDDDRSIDSAFKKQTKEMEAIAAVIAAARE